MQQHHVDASSRFRSLDDIWFYGGQEEHLQEAILAHTPSGEGEVTLVDLDNIDIKVRSSPAGAEGRGRGGGGGQPLERLQQGPQPPHQQGGPLPRVQDEGPMARSHISNYAELKLNICIEL